MKVSIKNYQAIKEATFEFGKGLTAIVGRTNAGKSSVIRAIESAINNKAGSSFINYDAKFCEVTIEDGENVVVWNKPNRGAGTYTLNGTTITKIGRTQNEEVAAILNMQEVVVNENKIRLNFWKQMEYPFLVGFTSMQLFNFISKSTEQEHIKYFQEEKQGEVKGLDSEIKISNTTVDVRRDDILELNKDLEKYKKFKDFDTKELEDLIKINSETKKTFEELLEKRKEIKETKLLLGKPLLVTSKLELVLKEIKPDLETLSKTGEFLEKIVELETTLVQDKEKLEKIKKEEKTLVSNLKKTKEVLEEVETLSNSLSTLLEDMDKVNNLTDNLKALKTQINDLEEEEQKKLKELNEFKVCPLCGHPLTEEHKH